MINQGAKQIASTILKGLLSVFLIGFSLSALGSDFAKEKRWADQIVDSLFDGEALYLNADNHEFLGIHTEATSETKKGAIIMHGSGVHPDWQTVIYPLRVELAELGLETLSIQMPVLANEAQIVDYVELFPQVTPRIDAAIEFFQNRRISEVFLIGHSLGASMGAYYLATTQAQLNGFAAIGLSSGIKDSDMDNLAHLAKLSIATLDLYGTEDLPGVVESAAKRNAAINPSINSRQIAAVGADHFFDGEEDVLVTHVFDWLENL